MKKVKFGIFADLHVDIMHDTEERLSAFLEDARKEKDLDFIIQLGDFCYPDEGRKVVCSKEKQPINIQNALIYPTYADKEKIISMYNNFEKPAYHVIGNHDCDMCSKKQILDYYNFDMGAYYSFDFGGVHFVVLDGNYMKIDGKYISYENGNYFEESGRPDRVLPYVSAEQLEWLKEDLSKTEYPAVFFSHQRLCTCNGSSVMNSEDIRKIIKDSPHGALIAFNGHAHIDMLQTVDDTYYLDINSISNNWGGVEYASEGRFGKEIDERFPNIKYTFAYKDPIYAFVEINDEEITVRGKKSTFAGPGAKELGCVKKTGKGDIIEIKPEIEDRRLKILG